MKSELATARVSDLVVEQPWYAAVFERLGIDYCCCGDRTLAEACQRGNLDVGVVERELAAQQTILQRAGTDWQGLTPTELCDHIEFTHHAFLRRELPVLAQLLEKVTQRHEAAHPELQSVRDAFELLQEELYPHMLKEERVLFPMIRRLASSDAATQVHCGNVKNPISVMESEHQTAGIALQRIRRLTNDYAPPPDACASYRTLLAGLERLEADLHLHIFKENHVLFPKALQLQERINRTMFATWEQTLQP
jgi:regulator of cell morphogenesis and NO signaling